MQTYIRRLLYATVFITGAAVLIVEVTAVRILSPFYGSTIYVLSSVLTIILGALSAGYYVGGKLSDRFDSHEPLFTIITTGGLAVLLINFLSLNFLPVGSMYFSVISGPLLFGLMFFFLPAFLLGIDSPYVIRLQSKYVSPDLAGSVVGTTFFWGTMGSIVGSLATGFLLIPVLGIQLSITMTGLVLVCLGITGSIALSFLVSNRKDTSICVLIMQRRYYLLSVLGVTCALLYLITHISSPSNMKTLYVSDGLYSKITVQEISFKGHPLRILKNDTNNSSATYLDSYDLVYGYTQFSEFYKELVPDARNYLVIGGGAYTVPRTLVARDPNLTVDVVEIDPELFDIAQEYFGLTDLTRIQNHVTDGRVFFKEYDTKYDVVFGDAFNTDYNIPTHLATREFFEEVKSHMTPNGIFMLNYVGTLKNNAPSLTGSFLKTITSVFPNTEVYAFERNYPDVMQNIMIVARNGDSEIKLDDNRVVTNLSAKRRIIDMKVEMGRFNSTDEIIFTDDKAPIEYLMFKQS